MYRPRSSTAKSLKSFGPEDHWIGQIVCRKYRIQRKLNQGSFGKIYACVHIDSNIEYAVKIEPCFATHNRRQIQETLLQEMEVLLALKGDFGFPRLQYFSKERDYNIMVTTLLGRNLEQLALDNQKVLPLKSVVYFAQQAIDRLRHLHEKGFVHRDVKPDNFVLGVGDNAQIVYLVDYGLTKSYLTESGEHIEQNSNAGMVGTVRYASTYSLQGLEQSRRDDLISLGYTFLYLLVGTLPWMEITILNKEERKQMILHKKLVIQTRELCRGQPDELRLYFNYCLNLKFKSTPDYDYLRNLFQALAHKRKLDMNNPWDHCLQETPCQKQKPIQYQKGQTLLSISNTLESLERHHSRPQLAVRGIIIEEQLSDLQQFQSVNSQSADRYTSNQSNRGQDTPSYKIASLGNVICKTIQDVILINNPMLLNIYGDSIAPDEFSKGPTISSRMKKLNSRKVYKPGQVLSTV